MSYALSPSVSSQSSGQLFYVFGASGVGKDTLMDFARERLADAPVVFAHRYITRPAELKGENHIHLADAEFANRLRRGCFKFHWQSHGWQYALGVEVDLWLSMGLNVVMNGSRAYFDQACTLHPGLVPVLITASPQVLKARLKRRGRESDQEIEERLTSAAAYSALAQRAGVRQIVNETSVEAAGTQLVQLFTSNGGE